MKKFLSLALALVMVLSVFAFNASAETYEEKTVDVNWNFGYVGSSTNSSWANKLNPTGGAYSYSDVIDMGPAGSTISFADEASGYASAAAYVFSFWKMNGAEYELDLEANNIPGYSITASRAYEFVTTEDNQAIRITYRSEQKADYVPVYEEVFVDGVKVDVVWNYGYVKADGTINPTGSAYSHTDVIVVPKAGSKVTFTDSNKDGSAFCSNSAFVFSTWTKDGDNWVFASGVKGEEATFTSPAVVYSYTSTKDNELVRLCYRSEEKADAPIDPALRPVVTLKSPVAAPETTEPAPETTAAPETTEPGASTDTGDSAIVLVVALVATVSLGVIATKKRSF